MGVFYYNKDISKDANIHKCLGIPSLLNSILKETKMSTLHHEDLLLQIFDEVQEAFPYYDEEKQIEIANQRFQDMCQ